MMNEHGHAGVAMIASAYGYLMHRRVTHTRAEMHLLHVDDKTDRPNIVIATVLFANSAQTVLFALSRKICW